MLSLRSTKDLNVCSCKAANSSDIDHLISVYSEFKWSIWLFFLLKSFKNGNKQADGKYVNGIGEGLWSNLYENGQKQSEVNFINGKMEGVSINWHSSGIKQKEGKYLEGKQDGLWTDWLEDGKKGSWMEIS